LDVNWEHLEKRIVELYSKTATRIPEDVLSALNTALSRETSETARNILSTILKNTEMAGSNTTTICQDTGTPIFFVDYSLDSTISTNLDKLHETIVSATRKATDQIPLRPNAVNTLTGKNSGNNTGEYMTDEFPVVYYDWHRGDKRTTISLLLKGGGSENVGERYKLPYSKLNANRDLEGVEKVVLDAIVKMQGKGCSPGTVSVCIGGSKDVIIRRAKKQLLIPIGVRNPNPKLADLEKRILEKANKLGIGPMGLGGNTTVLDVKVCSTYRHPASFFVEVAYNCWAARRGKIEV